MRRLLVLGAVLAAVLLLAMPASAHRGHYAQAVATAQHAYDVARALDRKVAAHRALHLKRKAQARQREHRRRTRPRCYLAPDQRRVLRRATAQARRQHASYIVRKALVEAGLVESRLRNLSYGHADSLGFLQQRPSMGWPSPRNVQVATRSFVTRAKRIAHRFRQAGRLAQAVQRSAFPARYHARRHKAARLLRSRCAR